MPSTETSRLLGPFKDLGVLVRLDVRPVRCLRSAVGLIGFQAEASWADAFLGTGVWGVVASSGGALCLRTAVGQIGFQKEPSWARFPDGTFVG